MCSTSALSHSNVHFHTLVPEGGWYEAPDGSVRFHALPPPTDEDIDKLVVRIVRRVARLLARRDAATPAAMNRPTHSPTLEPRPCSCR